MSEKLARGVELLPADLMISVRIQRRNDMKQVFYLSGSLFFLSLTLLVGFHLGAQSLAAQEVLGAKTVQEDDPGPFVQCWAYGHTPPGEKLGQTDTHYLSMMAASGSVYWVSFDQDGRVKNRGQWPSVFPEDAWKDTGH
jgi:hypothetical protein